MTVSRLPPPADGPDPRRDTPRVDGTFLAWVRPDDGGPGSLARTVDLSSRGVGLMVTRPLDVGRSLSVEFVVTPTVRLHAVGTVQHCTSAPSGYRAGIAFDAAPTLIDNSSRTPNER